MGRGKTGGIMDYGVHTVNGVLQFNTKKTARRDVQVHPSKPRPVWHAVEEQQVIGVIFAAKALFGERIFNERWHLSCTANAGRPRVFALF
mmetsp:Transcript_28658/g.72636  ORF Transcript_28658/g.72636 Transcript_28658/m.72636 type:complete len:90 (-) Transcript_28658:33-302(-)